MRYFLLLHVLISPLFGNPSWDQLKNRTVSEELPQIFGWCTKEKAEVLMDLIYENKPKLCVEIGTFAGASSYPILCALKYLDCGILYTIDPWNEEALLKGYEEDLDFQNWWKNTRIQLEQICLNFHTMIHEKNLSSYCYSVRMLSVHGGLIFQDESIDFLHIDGNTSEQGSLEDIHVFFSKVKQGGFICLSNAKIQTRTPMLVFLFEHCDWIQEKSKQDFLIFKKL